MDGNGFQITTIANNDMAAEQLEAIFEFLGQQCFADVSLQEVEENYFTDPMAYVLCYLSGELVGCASAYLRDIEHEGHMLRLGGISIVCTRRDMRGQGVATQVCTEIMQLLKDANCDVVFLATSEMARPVYEKMGFHPLKVFSWENIHGQVKTGTNGMVAAVRSPAMAEAIWQNEHTFHVGKGYW